MDSSSSAIDTKAESQTQFTRWPDFVKLKVLANKPLNQAKTVHILRICLEDKNDVLGCGLGGLVQIRGLSNEVSENFPFGKLFLQSYVPISWPDKKGHFDIIYKFKDEYEGDMSDFLVSLNRGSYLEVRSIDRRIDAEVLEVSHSYCHE